jgi:hypothetical protein
LLLHPEVRGLIQATTSGPEEGHPILTKKDKDGKEFKVWEWLHSSSSKVVEHLPRHPKVKGLSLAGIAGICMGNITEEYWAQSLKQTSLQA